MTAATTEQTVSSTEGKPTESNAAIAAQPLSSNPVSDSDKAAVISKVAEIHSFAQHDLTRLKPAVTSRLPLTAGNVQATLTKAASGSTFALIVVGVISLVPILQLIVGWRYADECPVNWHIPRYLLVAGIAGLTTIILAIIFVLLTLYVTSRMRASDARTPGIAVGCGLCSILVVLILFILFLCGWFVAGCIWVFRVWNKVQYETSYRSDYCHPMLYRFAFWLLLTSIVSYVFACTVSSRQGRRLLIISRNDTSTRVLTSEA